MGKLYQGYLRLIVWPQTEQTLPSIRMSGRELTITAMSVCSRQSGKLLTRTEFYAELKRMTARVPKTDPNTVTYKALITSNPIAAIKALREVSGLGLKEAKDVVDLLRSGVHQTVRLTNPEAQRSLAVEGFKF